MPIPSPARYNPQASSCTPPLSASSLRLSHCLLSLLRIMHSSSFWTERAGGTAAAGWTGTRLQRTFYADALAVGGSAAAGSLRCELSMAPASGLCPSPPAYLPSDLLPLTLILHSCTEGVFCLPPLPTLLASYPPHTAPAGQGSLPTCPLNLTTWQTTCIRSYGARHGTPPAAPSWRPHMPMACSPAAIALVPAMPTASL